MSKFNIRVSLLTLSCLACFKITDSLAAPLSPIDKQREDIVILSRQGDAQLDKAIIQLRQLYTASKNLKVRDDLIALLMRQGNFKGALNVCPQCDVQTFSANELENLARAARNEKQFAQSLTFYSRLRTKFPSNPNGLLGSALAATELGQYSQAKNYLTLYRRKFGEDAGYREAINYLADHTESDISKLGRWQKELAQRPDNHDLAVKLYRLAAKYSLYPLQRQIETAYPTLFSDKDRAWLEYAESVDLSRGTGTSKQQLTQSYQRLSEVLETQEKSTALYRQALQDRLVLAARLHNAKQVSADYEALSAVGTSLPAYVNEAYADSLLRSGSPFRALAIYQQLERQERQTDRQVRNALLFKLVNASSDAGYFQLAEAYLNQINEPPFVNDYTHNYRIANSHHDTLFFAQVNLLQWRGNNTKAAELLRARLRDKTPGDPWTMLALSDIERSRYHYDDAMALTNKASRFLRPQDQTFYRSLQANILLDRGDWKHASEILEHFSPQDKENTADLLERYALLSAPRLTGAFGIQHKTFPKDGQSNEITQEYYLYSAKSRNGHQAYVHYLENNSPTTEKNLKQQRIGAGAIVNLYPIEFNLEAGKGTRLNHKAYFSLSTDYTFNDNWRFSLSGNLNGSGTPLKAINQNIYSKDFTFSAQYTYSDRFQLGGGANLMKFDDSNRRRSLFIWANTETYKRDRWTLNNSVRFDYQKNDEISSAAYYNPAHSRNIEFGADLSYLQPMNYALVLTHHLKAGAGHYSQSNEAGENSWSVSYGHEWRVGKKVGISYEIGRKKNIYDGEAEFNNFANLNFSIYF